MSAREASSKGTGPHKAQAPHVIRLRGPWESDRGQIKLPCDWGAALGETVQRVRLSRRFGLPSGLEPGNCVRLRIESPHAILHATLNDAPLPIERVVDITARLESANRLVLELTQATGCQRGMLDVQLEIA